jgi:hypothetical protein
VHEGAREAVRQKRDYAVEFRTVLPPPRLAAHAGISALEARAAIGENGEGDRWSERKRKYIRDADKFTRLRKHFGLIPTEIDPPSFRSTFMRTGSRLFLPFFQAVDFGAARPPQLVVGTGGDNLSVVVLAVPLRCIDSLSRSALCGNWPAQKNC